MINIASTQLNRCKLDIKPCQNWEKEPIMTREVVCASYKEDPELDELLGYDSNYCLVLMIKLDVIKLDQSLTILFAEEKQRTAILKAVQLKRKSNSHYLSLLQVDTDKYRVSCTPKLSIS
ncbi:hypothetical protein [uncultured Bacteroides sp.]|uniref:hypothetical protein n=1 Tax=uncultured Bacteroides sp. TaxID=162156 RepID=UPI002AAB1E9B|nr:hypothetical protein [uncultured Bacteroides sp.]